MKDKAKRIAEMNDFFRKTFFGGKVMLTPGITALKEREEVLSAVRGFKNFEAGDDPYGEHDFGAVEINGTKAFWKIDYYDKAMEFGSENPADASVTTRVLTVMLAEEY